MTFRLRLTVAAAGAVAAVLMVVSVIVFTVVRGQLRSEVDDGLRRQAAAVAAGGPLAGAGPEGPADIQVVTAGGAVTLATEGLSLPLSGPAQAVASGRRSPFLTDLRLGSDHLRMVVAPIGNGRAVQIAVSLRRVDDVLHHLIAALVTVGAAGVLAAMATGAAVAGAVMGPLKRLTAEARRVAASPEAGARVDVGDSADELATLAASFNDMLRALDGSLRTQRQLVADASHELRTPLTSARTNLEVLARMPELGGHRQLVDDLVAELDNLNDLVADLMELARYDQVVEAPVDVRLDHIVAAVLHDVRRRTPDLPVTVALAPVVVQGVPARLKRAVANILDNAVKWNTDGQPIEVAVSEAGVVVRDHGPGIAVADLPFVFDRFYRATDARRLPGSGLGLAIVRRVAEAHGGAVVAERAEGGGTRVCLQLSGTRIDE